MRRMLVLFEVHMAPGSDPDALLSADVERETKAQIMTLDQAAKVGFQGLPPAPPGVDVRLVAVAKRDAPWIHRLLETHEGVGTFKVHDVD